MNRTATAPGLSSRSKCLNFGGACFSWAEALAEKELAISACPIVALAKRTLAQADLASGRLVAPFPDGSEAVGFAYSVVQPRDRPPSPSATAFVAWLKRQAVDHDNTMGQL